MSNAATRPSSIPNSGAPNWVIAPAARCVSSVAEGIRLAGLLHRAVIALAKQGPLLALAHEKIKSAGGDTGSIDRLRSEQVGLESWANDMLRADLHDLHTSGVISLWTSLEVAVEDTAVLVLLRDHTAVTLLLQMGVRPPAGMTSPPSENDARRLFVRFDRLVAGTRRVSEAYCHVLGTLGVVVTVDQSVHDKLAELNYVRNCLLHRGGIVDERVSAEAPRLGIACGATLHIGRAAYLSYFEAAETFTLALVDAAVQSRHVYVSPPSAP